MAAAHPLADDRPRLDDYALEDRYRREAGRVFLTGTQALVRIPLMQKRLDHAAGLNTAGFISGYRGSPLGTYDIELWKAKKLLDEHGVRFLPAVNEDLAATALLGTQQVEAEPGSTVDGVFGIWYGKGPGVDRAGDALKHGNAYGSSPRGGVLVVAGDDHGCVSSSMPHQSDAAFIAWFMPILNPANVAEYLEYGLYGFALSRFSGMWVGFKAVSETVESAMSVELPPSPRFVTPGDFEFRSYAIDHGTQSVDTTGTLFWTLCGDHADLVSTSDGKSYLVGFECWNESAIYRIDITLPQSAENDAARQKQRDDNVMLVDIAWEDHGHISCATKGPNKDWCF